MIADATSTADQLARSNTLGSLTRNRDKYRKAGDADLAALKQMGNHTPHVG